jgi:hypothetical protein
MPTLPPFEDSGGPLVKVPFIINTGDWQFLPEKGSCSFWGSWYVSAGKYIPKTHLPKDFDILVCITDGNDLTVYINKLLDQGFQDVSSEYTTLDLFEFSSFRKGFFNITVVSNVKYYLTLLAAGNICREGNVYSKSSRIEIYKQCLYILSLQDDPNLSVF